MYGLTQHNLRPHITGRRQDSNNAILSQITKQQTANIEHPLSPAELGNEGVSTHTHHPRGGVHGKYAKAIGLLKILQKYDLCVDGNAFLPSRPGDWFDF